MAEKAEKTGPAITRCEFCFSDKTIEFDDGSGVCTQCKTIIGYCPYPGMSYPEFQRLRGTFKGDLSVVNDEDKVKLAEDARKAAGKAKKVTVEDVESVESMVAKLVKVKPVEPVKVAQAKKPKKPRKGILTSLKTFVSDILFGTEKDTPAISTGSPAKTDGQKKPKKAIKAGLAIVNPVPGESWSIGPCIACELPGKSTGKVMDRAHRNGKKRFVVIQRGDGAIYHGCALCANKA